MALPAPEPERSAADRRLDAVVDEALRRGYSIVQTLVGYPEEDFPGLLEEGSPEALSYARAFAADRGRGRGQSGRRSAWHPIVSESLRRRENIERALRRVNRDEPKGSEAAAILEVAARIIARADLSLLDEDRCLLAEALGPLFDPERYPTKDQRALVMIRDGFACCRCGSVEDLTIDHVVPWSKGGATEVENLQTLCRSCNSRKGASLPARVRRISDQ